MSRSAEIPPLVLEKLDALERSFSRAVSEHAAAGVPVVL